MAKAVLFIGSVNIFFSMTQRRKIGGVHRPREHALGHGNKGLGAWRCGGIALLQIEVDSAVHRSRERAPGHGKTELGGWRCGGIALRRRSCSSKS